MYLNSLISFQKFFPPPKPIPDYQRMNRMMEKNGALINQQGIFCTANSTDNNRQRMLEDDKQMEKCSTTTNHDNGIGIVTETSL